MRLTIKEALNRQDRVVLKSVSVASLSRDESNGSLAIGFRATKDELETMDGLLGISRSGKTGSHGITDATEELMRRTCTGIFSSPDARLEKDELEHLRNIIEAVSVDAASDEVRSGLMMGGSVMRSGSKRRSRMACGSIA